MTIFNSFVYVYQRVYQSMNLYPHLYPLSLWSFHSLIYQQSVNPNHGHVVSSKRLNFLDHTGPRRPRSRWSWRWLAENTTINGGFPARFNYFLFMLQLFDYQRVCRHVWFGFRGLWRHYISILKSCWAVCVQQLPERFSPYLHPQLVWHG